MYHSLHQPRADPVEQEAQRDHGGGDRGTSGGGGLYRVQGSKAQWPILYDFIPKLCCLFFFQETDDRFNLQMKVIFVFEIYKD